MVLHVVQLLISAILGGVDDVSFRIRMLSKASCVLSVELSNGLLQDALMMPPKWQRTDPRRCFLPAGKLDKREKLVDVPRPALFNHVFILSR